MTNLDTSEAPLPPNTVAFRVREGEVARITPDGVMRFSVEANDMNAARFVECIERFLDRRLTGIEAQLR